MSERRPPGGETGRPLPADEHLPDGGTELSPCEIEALGSRWASAWTPDEVARRLAGVRAPWCVAAGWALDLFRGRQTRAHGDIEIAVPAGRFPEVRRRFPGYVFDAAGSGRIWEDAAPDVLAAVHQTWVRDPATGDYLLDVFREPHDGDTWICRRDGSIRRPYDEIVHHTRDGIPYLAPELVLLFKAKHARPKDQADFDATLPYLSPEQRTSLARLLDRVHPGHPWSAGL
ncbi:nucleotidyltransferase domain-containing protein [Streptomyces parvus]|uniref:nucleotidyltransferase domain-containing protein n=1 Tax=Streptomyces parvus TaxID=66428 RepID=UPI0035DC575D